MTDVLLCLVIAFCAFNGYMLLLVLRTLRQQKAKIGRPRGSRNKSATLVEQAETYFGPAEKKPMSAEDLSKLVAFVNKGDKAIEDEMIDPNDEMRTGVGYAGT